MQKKKSYKLRKLTLASVKRTLTPGQCLKYCKLCELLGQPKYTGVQKTSQLREFGRYFDFEKTGIYFLITDIHTTVSDPFVKKIRSDATFPNLIGYLLFNDIYRAEGDTFALTCKKWWLRLNMINQEYIDYITTADMKKKLTSLDEHMTIDDVNNFFRRAEKGIYRIFKNALESLEKRGLIKTEVVYTVVTADGKVIRPLDSPKNKKIWLQTQKEALEKMGLKSMAQLQYYPESVAAKFYQIVDQLRLNAAGWEKGYTSLEITLTEKGIKEAKVFSGEGVVEIRQQLNDSIRSSINKQIVSKNLMNYKREDDDYFGDTFNKEMEATHCIPLNLQLLLSDKLLTCHN